MSCSDPSEAASRVEPRSGPSKAALGWDCLFFSRGGAGEVGERRCTVRPPRLLFGVSGGERDADPLCSSHHWREGKPAGPLPGQEVSVRGPRCP